MSIVSVDEIGGRSKDFSEDMSRKYVKRFRVVSDVMNESESVIEGAAGLPALFDPHPTDAGSLLISFTLDQDEEEPFFWTVECRYSPLTFGSSGGSNIARSDPAQRTEDPLARPAVITLDSDPYEKPAVRDIDGLPIVNSANDRFDPPLMKQASRPTFTISKNVASVDYLAWRTAHNTINSATYLGFTAGTLMLVKLSYRSQFENDLYFFECTAAFAGAVEDDELYGSGLLPAPLSWQPRVLDEGYHCYEVRNLAAQSGGGSGGGFEFRNVKVKMLLQGGTEPSHPLRLDGTGFRLDDDAELEDSVYKQFNIYRTMDFATLGLL